MKTATLGPKGTFSYEAVLKKYKNSRIIFKNTVWDVFEAVDRQEADNGVVPIENSVSGTIGLTLDALMEFDLSITAEIILPVRHSLVGNDGLKGIETLYVHPATYEQCEKFIRKNLPDVKIIYTSSNAVSAQMVSKQDDKAKAAIVPRKAEDIYNLKFIRRDVQDNNFNVTRFVVISKEGIIKEDISKGGKEEGGKSARDSKGGKEGDTAGDSGRDKGRDEGSDKEGDTGRDKGRDKGSDKGRGIGRDRARERTSIAIYPQIDRPGLLYHLLGEFAKRGINLTKIESRPSKGRLGDYIFFIDIEGGKEDKRIKEAFKSIEKSFFLKILGSYPREY